MTTSCKAPTTSWDRIDGILSARREERTEHLASCIAAACLAFRRPMMRSTTIAAVVDGETHAHCLRRAQGLLPAEDFELHAQRLAFLRSSSEADLGSACRKAWMAGAGRAYRACIQLMKKRLDVAGDISGKRGVMPSPIQTGQVEG